MLASITSTLTDAIGTYGIYAVFLLMAVDAVLPAGGEIVMLYAGALASGSLEQHATLLGIVLGDGLPAYVALALAGALGYLAGSMAGWGVGMRGGPALVERYGHLLHLGPQRMARAERWFDRYGSRAVLLGRLTPLVRSFISIPAGVLGSPVVSYAALTLAGSLIWCFGFAGAGWAVGAKYENLHHTLRFVDYVGAAALVAILAGAVIQWRRAGREGLT